MKRIHILIIIFSILVFIYFFVSAQTITFGPYTKAKTLNELAKEIQKIAYLILIPLSILMILIGAFQFLTSAGAPEKTTKAKQTLFYAAIGVFLIILAAAFPSILSMILGVEKLTIETTPPNSPTSPQNLNNPNNWPSDPSAALDSFLSNQDFLNQVGNPELSNAANIRGEINELFSF